MRKSAKSIGAIILMIVVIVIVILVTIGLSGGFRKKQTYEYVFYFQETYENGSLEADTYEHVDRTQEHSVIVITNNDLSNEFIKFTATPNEGYRVKQWKVNGEIVEGVKTISYSVWLYQPGEIYVTVEFESIVAQ